MNTLTHSVEKARRFIQEYSRVFRHFRVALALARRELKGRYRSSWLGFLWTFIEPFLLMCIFFFVFAIVFQQKRENYLLFLNCGMLPFFCFQNSVNKATASIVANTSLIRQIYCPRQIFVLVGVLSELYHFFLSLVVLVPFYIYYRMIPDVQVIAVIPITILLALLCVGLGLFLGALNVFVRDTSIFMGLIMRMLFYMTPIFYDMARFDGAPSWALRLYYLNPLTILVGLYRWALISEPLPHWHHIGVLLIEILVALVVGSVYFYRKDNDIVKVL